MSIKLFLKFLFNNTLDEPNKNKICIKINYKEIKSFGDYLGWNDGTFSSTCEQYRWPQSFSITMLDKLINYFFFTLTLLAKTGSGVYRLETANL